MNICKLFGIASKTNDSDKAYHGTYNGLILTTDSTIDYAEHPIFLCPAMPD